MYVMQKLSISRVVKKQPLHQSVSSVKLCLSHFLHKYTCVCISDGIVGHSNEFTMILQPLRGVTLEEVVNVCVCHLCTTQKLIHTT